MSRPTYAEIDTAAVRENVRTLRSLLAPGVKLLGVVKADAYGHGAVEVSRVLEAEGVDMLGVALVEEGVELRVAGLRTPILVMGLMPDDEIDAAIAYDLTATVADAAGAEAISRRAVAHDAAVGIHLKIDTGMSRLGVRSEEAAETAAAIARLPHVNLAGTYTHFACADSDANGATADQLRRFTAALDAMRAAGAAPRLVHAANSSATIVLPEAHFDMVRTGLAVYGVRPCAAAATVPLKPALRLTSHVAQLKRVYRGEGVSYGHTWRAGRDSLLGVLPIGYADGYPRRLSNLAQARAGGRLVPVVGHVCMDLTMVDLTDVPDARAGMAVALIEADHDSPLSAASLAALAGTIAYEILSGLGERIPRVYR